MKELGSTTTGVGGAEANQGMSNDPHVNTALWNFCMRANDGPREPSDPVTRRDPAELQWLREALESVELPDQTIKRLLRQLGELDAPPTPAASSSGLVAIPDGKAPEAAPPIQQVLEELSELVEDINCAREFQLMKGPELVLAKLRSRTAATEPPVRGALLGIVAHAAQNSESLQESFTECKWPQLLVPLLREEQVPSVRAACLLACSALCRGGYSPSAAAFLHAGGFEALERLVERCTAADTKSAARALRLAQYFAEQKVSSNAMVDIAAAAAVAPEADVAESAAGLLTAVLAAQPFLASSLYQRLLPALGQWSDAGEEYACRRDLLSRLSVN